MKKLLSLIVLAGVVAACGPRATQHPVITQEGLFTPTAAATEGVAIESAAAVQETPLPTIAEAPIIEAPEILNIEMIDEANGWALTEQQVVRTDDGGVTWYDVTPAGLTDVGYFVYSNFFDASHVWLQLPVMNNMPNGGTLYRTTDGGLTWKTFNTPFSDGSLHFVDEQNGWMLANLGAGAGSNAVSVFKTSDGGATWERTYTNDPNFEGASDTLPLSGLKSFILPLDADTAWVGGVVYAPGEAYLFRTDDSGKTWFHIKLVLPEGAAESELNVLGIVFVSSTEGLLALRISSETSQTVVYITEDGGNTWAQLPATFEGYGKLSTPSTSEMIFYTADQFYVTSDAGATIQQVAPDVKFGDSILDMSFVNAQTGWVIVEDSSGGRSLYRTSDGGVTWFPQIP